MSITFSVPESTREPTEDEFWAVWFVPFVFDRSDESIAYADAWYYQNGMPSVPEAFVYNADDKTVTIEWIVEIITPSFPQGTYDNLFFMDEDAYIAKVVAASQPESPFSAIADVSITKPFATEESYSSNRYPYCGHR